MLDRPRSGNVLIIVLALTLMVACQISLLNTLGA